MSSHPVTLESLQSLHALSKPILLAHSLHTKPDMLAAAESFHFNLIIEKKRLHQQVMN